METLVIVADHRNQYYGRDKSHHGSARFGLSSSKGFREINCRAFDYGRALLPNPLNFSSTPPLTDLSGLSSPRTPTTHQLESGEGKATKKSVKSSPISIISKDGKKERPWNHVSTPFSELWAGPAYSNSPPASSLPIPKFSIKPKRTVSLESLPVVSEISPYPLAKSAPVSHPRESKNPAITFDDDTATMTLRRILNLDGVDD